MKLSDNKFNAYLAPFITAVLLLIIYAIKGIYPFGNVTIDYYDMAQQIAAFYYHVFDVLHGTKALFYDPYTALGVNMAMSTSGCSNLSVFNLFFLFIKRNMLLESLSFFLMLKLMCMSIAMGFYLRKTYRLPLFYETIFSVVYAFSGFVFVLYVTIQWLDIAVFFPVIMYFLNKVLFKRQYIGYIAFLTMSLVASYYLSFMILIYIIIVTGLLMLSDFISDIKKQGNIEAVSLKYNLTGLLMSTVVSILLSLFIVMPQLKQTLSSARFKNGTESSGLLSVYIEIIKNYKPAYTTRWWTLLSLSICAAIIVVGLIRYYKERKIVITAIACIFLMTAELFFENINLIWHFGSYVQYPIRNGFIINFTFVSIAALFVKKLIEDGYLSNKLYESKSGKILAVVISTFVCIAVLFICIRMYSLNAGMPLRKVFHITAIAIALSFALYIILLIVKKGRFTFLMPCFLATEIIFYGFLLIGKPTFITGYAENPEQEGEYIRICNQLEDAFSIKPDKECAYLLDRVKNPDESLNANYPLVLRKPALSNWTHIISPRLQNSAKQLGYSIEYTRLLDSGGTVFSDALLGIKEIITCVRQDESLYELLEKADIEIDHLTKETATYYHYKCKYTLPFAMEINSDEDVFEYNDTVEIYNGLFRLLCNEQDGHIAEYVYNYETDKGIIDKGDKKIVDNTLSIKGKKALYYIASQTDTQDENTVIIVNGNIVKIPSIKQTDNTLYPAKYNNNAIYLGLFEDESVDFYVSFNKYNDLSEEYDVSFSPKVISIDMNELEWLCSKANERTNQTIIKANMDGYEITTSEDAASYLCLPVSYDAGFTLTSNGKKIKSKSAGDIFTIIPVNGSEKIEMKFIPSCMRLGIIISVVTLIIVLIYVFGTKYNYTMFSNEKLSVVNLCMTYICLIGYIVVICFMYVIPLIGGAVLWIF